MATKNFCSKLGQALVVSLLIFIGLIPTRSVVSAQVPSPTPGATAPASNWSDPIAFDRTGWFPDIATDASGRIHVAWSNSAISSPRGSSYREGYDTVLYTSSPNGDSWDPINEIAALKETVAGNIEVTRPDLLINSKGIFHMTFRDIFVHYSQAPVQLAASARNWAKPEVMTTNSLGYFSRLNVNSKGRLHMIYTADVGNSDCLICYHIFYRSSDNGGADWSTETDISVIPTGSAKPQILVDDQDNIHVVWEAGRGGTLGQLPDPTNVMYTVSYNRGETWSPPIQFVAPKAERSKNITIGQDGHGNLVAAWWSLPEDMVYYQTSSDHGLSWSEPTRLPDVWGIWANYNSRLDDYAMATDSGGNLHLVMVGRLTEKDPLLRLIHLVWDGKAWSKPEAIVSYNGDAPEWPRIAISNGNQVNVVWFVRGADFIWTGAGDYYKVYYARTRVDTPYIGSVPWPTMVVKPTATPTLEPTAQMPTQVTDVPKINATLDARQTNSQTYSEIGQLNVLGTSLIPVLIVVGLLLAIILLRRR